MTGYCLTGDHAGCPDAQSDSGVCSCPCHLIGDAVDAIDDTSEED